MLSLGMGDSLAVKVCYGIGREPLAKGKVSIVRWNLKEASGKILADEQELHIRLNWGGRVCHEKSADTTVLDEIDVIGEGLNLGR